MPPTLFDTSMTRNLVAYGFFSDSMRFGLNSVASLYGHFSNRYRVLDLLISSICFPFHANLSELFWFAEFGSEKEHNFYPATGVLPRPKCELLLFRFHRVKVIYFSNSAY